MEKCNTEGNVYLFWVAKYEAIWISQDYSVFDQSWFCRHLTGSIPFSGPHMSHPQGHLPEYFNHWLLFLKFVRGFPIPSWIRLKSPSCSWWILPSYLLSGSDFLQEMDLPSRGVIQMSPHTCQLFFHLSDNFIAVLTACNDLPLSTKFCSSLIVSKTLICSVFPHWHTWIRLIIYIYSDVTCSVLCVFLLTLYMKCGERCTHVEEVPALWSATSFHERKRQLQKWTVVPPRPGVWALPCWAQPTHTPTPLAEKAKHGPKRDNQREEETPQFCTGAHP